MLKRALGCLCISLLMVYTSGCNQPKEQVKIGVSFGVGSATRWVQEKSYMEAKAKELGADIEVRLNTSDQPKTQKEDCFEMIDSGIDVLILTPRDAYNVGEIIAYAKKKNVPVINYSRVVFGEKVDLFVGYDSGRIGQKQGQYLSEMAYQGNYILLKGDPGDHNAALLHDGAMRYIAPIMGNINVILEAAIENWSPDEAKKVVMAAITAHGNKVDAILAPNDKIAGACAEALAELNITNHVVITGMDAELAAVKRILADTQDVTFYMDLQALANTAVAEAYHMARKEKVNVNADFDNQSGAPIAANLITGQLITKKNIDKVLIDSGYYSKAEVYGKSE